MDKEKSYEVRHPITAKTILKGAALSGAVSIVLTVPVKAFYPTYDPGSAIIGAMFTNAVILSFVGFMERKKSQKIHDV